MNELEALRVIAEQLVGIKANLLVTNIIFGAVLGHLLVRKN